MSVNVEGENKYSDEQKDVITKTVASLDDLKVLTNDPIFKKLDEIERKLTYKRFYFPGSEIKLFVEGEGVDNDDTHYVSDFYGMSFDPRFVKEYIYLAKLNGYEKHVLYYDPIEGKFKTANYEIIDKYFRAMWDIINESIKKVYAIDVVQKEQNINILASYLAALIYFAKEDDFIHDMEGAEGYLQSFYNSYGNKVNSYIRKIGNYTGKTKDEFIQENYGFLAEPNLAFNAEQEIDEYLKYQEEYQEFKEKLWKIFSQVSTLQLCASSISGIQQASGSSNITLQQYNTCAIEMEEENKNKEDKKETIVNDGDANLIVDDETGDIKDVVLTPNIYKPVEEGTTQNNTHVSDDKIYTIIILCIAIIFVFLFFIVFILKRRKAKINYSRNRG